MAQAQKHWIQAMLHEESWIPFEVTYDVTAWSNPLLMNLDGGWTGEDVDPGRRRSSPPASGPGRAGRRPTARRSACSRSPTAPAASRPPARPRYLFSEVWDLPFTRRRRRPTSPPAWPASTSWSSPTATRNYGVQALGAKGKRALRDWVNAGGRIVAWQGGVEVAVKAGVSTVKLGDSQTERARHARPRRRSTRPARWRPAIGDRDWVMYQDDRTMQPGLGTAVATFPAPGTPDYATSGLAIGVDTLAGTAAVVDEAVGDGRVVAFSIDPNFRAWTQGTQRLLWNAIVGPDRAGPDRPRGRLEGAGGGREGGRSTPPRRCPTSARRSASGSPRADAAATAKVLQRHGAEVVRQDVDGDVLFLVANRKDLSYDEHPSFALVVRDLEQAGIDIRAASLP